MFESMVDAGWNIRQFSALKEIDSESRVHIQYAFEKNAGFIVTLYKRSDRIFASGQRSTMFLTAAEWDFEELEDAFNFANNLED